MARLDDAAELHKIINEAYRTENSWTTEANYVKGERISLDALQLLIKEQRDPLLVAEVPSSASDSSGSKMELAGCISAEASHLHPQMNLPDKSALIGLFAVSPNHQSRGVGSRLFNACLDWIRVNWLDCDDAILWVIKQREDIRKWYERLGFKWTGEYRAFVLPDLCKSDDVEFMIYSKPLKQK